jgi:SAM-dependent methyltransferase/glycosyltransferase involved in cell wall biosynthesis
MTNDILLASPWPPAPSEIANNVAQVQVPALVTQCDLHLIGVPPPDKGPIPDIPTGSGFLPVKGVLESLEAHPAATLLAHVGNEAQQNTAAMQALFKRAGFVVVHDLTLHHAWFDQCMRTHRFVDYVRSVGEFYGPGVQQRAYQARFNTPVVHTLAQSVPLFEPFLRNALGAIVHSKVAFNAVASSNRWPVCRLDLPYAAPSAGQAQQTLAHRAAQVKALRDGEPLRLVVFGHLSANRCVPLILEAMLALQSAAPRPVRLDIYGKAAGAERLQAFIDEHQLAHCVQLHGFVPEQTLIDGLKNAHLGINLRSPTMGEASASQLRLYAAGLPSIVMQAGWYGEQPSNAVFHLPEQCTPSMLVRAVLEVLHNPEVLLSRAEAGLAHIRNAHDPARYVRQLLGFMQAAEAEGKRLLGTRLYMHSLAEATVDLGLSITGNISHAVQSLLAPLPAASSLAHLDDLPPDCLLPQANRHTVAQLMQQHISLQLSRSGRAATGRLLTLDDHLLLQIGSDWPPTFTTPSSAMAAQGVRQIEASKQAPSGSDGLALQGAQAQSKSFADRQALLARQALAATQALAADQALAASQVLLQQRQLNAQQPGLQDHAQAAVAAQQHSQNLAAQMHGLAQSPNPVSALNENAAADGASGTDSPARNIALANALCTAASHILQASQSQADSQAQAASQALAATQQRMRPTLGHTFKPRKPEPDPNLAELAQRSQPRSGVPGALKRLGLSFLARPLLRAWNFMSREWREPLELVQRIASQQGAVQHNHAERVGQLESHLSDHLNPLVHDLSDQMADLQANATELSAHLEQVNTQGVRLSSHLVQLSALGKSTAVQLGELDQKVGGYVGDVGVLNGYVQQLSTHVRQLSDQGEQLSLQGAQHSSHVLQLGAQVDQFGAYVSVLSEQGAALGNHMAQLDTHMSQLSAQVGMLHSHAEVEIEGVRNLARQLIMDNQVLRQQLTHGFAAINSRLNSQSAPNAAAAVPSQTANWQSDRAPFVIPAAPREPVPALTWPPALATAGAAVAPDSGSTSDAGNAQVSAFMQHVADHFRGDGAQLRQRLSGHLPAVAQAAEDVRQRAGQTAQGRSFAVLDLGCGRGEWLDVLREAGQAAQGVDLAPECVSACLDQGLQVLQGDALRVLQYQTAPGSLAAVTAFQLIEHLPLLGQIQLFASAYAALAPGGVLLVETPNPENLRVISCNFWYDPTHQRPLPAEFLRLLALHAGFAADQIQTQPLHPPQEPGLDVEIQHYPPRTRHMLFCGEDTILRAWKR